MICLKLRKNGDYCLETAENIRFPLVGDQTEARNEIRFPLVGDQTEAGNNGADG